MTQEEEVVRLMESSQTSDEWNNNADKVKTACDGYPSFWFRAVVLSGVMARVTARWGGSDRISVSPL